MTASAEQLAQLRAVNSQVNATSYEALGKDASGDVWRDAPAPGETWECRDYTVAKAKALRSAGWPVADMFVVLCWIEPEPPTGNPTGAPVRQYHAVLGCTAGGELYILDNRAPDIYRCDELPYDYLWAHQQVPGTLTWRDARGGLTL
jgi:predicted transglutaminase-like cysteine proteinase